MIKRESKFSILFRHWIMANPMDESCSLEMKQTTTNSIPFSYVEDHQLNYADAIQNSKKGVLIRVLGTNGEPDYIYLKHAPSHFVVKFPDFFCIIDSEIWNDEKAASVKRKSLTADRAREIASTVVEL